MADLRPDELAELADESDKFPDSVTRDFAMAKDAAWLKTKDASFADTVREYKAVESMFTARAADNEVYVLEMRRGVAESIFADAVIKCEAFETCMACWEDVVRLGITDIETRCTMTWYFAECCRRNKKTELGLESLEPLIAELQQLRADPSVDPVTAEYYEEQIEFMVKLRAKLEAQRS